MGGAIALSAHLNRGAKKKVLQIRGSKIIYFSMKTSCCDPSLEPSQRDGANDE